MTDLIMRTETKLVQIGDVPVAFRHRRWDDGCEQYAYELLVKDAGYAPAGTDDSFIAIERVKGLRSRRKQWVVVSRGSSEAKKYDEALYPPKIAGPFKTIEAAAQCYFTIMTLRGWRIVDVKYCQVHEF